VRPCACGCAHACVCARAAISYPSAGRSAEIGAEKMVDDETSEISFKINQAKDRKYSACHTRAHVRAYAHIHTPPTAAEHPAPPATTRIFAASLQRATHFDATQPRCNVVQRACYGSLQQATTDIGAVCNDDPLSSQRAALQHGCLDWAVAQWRCHSGRGAHIMRAKHSSSKLMLYATCLVRLVPRFIATRHAVVRRRLRAGPRSSAHRREA
jgi:hypothetical protein